MYETYGLGMMRLFESRPWERFIDAYKLLSLTALGTSPFYKICIVYIKDTICCLIPKGAFEVTYKKHIELHAFKQTYDFESS